MKKFTSLVLVMMLVSLAVASAFAASTVTGTVYGDQQAAGANKPAAQVQQDLQKAGIKDVQADDWYAGSITVLAEAGLLKPDANGNIKPDAKLSSGEGVSIFAKVLGIAGKNDSPDVALTKAKEAGLVGGSVNPDKDLSRMEVARMLAKALGIESAAVTNASQYPFNDFNSASPEDRGILKSLYDLGIFKGYEDKTFRPDSILTKAQIAILVDRILGSK